MYFGFWEEVMKQELAKPIVAVLANSTELLEDAIAHLENYFGPCDFRGGWHPFTQTDYYEDEMGRGLKRCILAFKNLVPAHEANAFKGWTSEVERSFTKDGRRSVNIDPGYVDNLKMVLVSGKCGGHKICTAPGIFVDYLLWYNKGWQPFPWSFPDFRDGTYDDELTSIRKIFKEQTARA